MKYLDEYRDRGIARGLTREIAGAVGREVAFMEFCGGHTVTIARYGLESLLPGKVHLLSGPGCPVCVTPMDEIDRMIALARMEGVIIATYGDMLRVPGTDSSLADERGRGADVRAVYSSYDAVDLARDNPEREVVFFGIGFETTAPATAAAVLRAEQEGVGNFSVVSAHKTTPAVIRTLLDTDELALDGLICPGHVSVITGTAPYARAAERGVACVISGFEPVDVLQSVLMLIRQVERGQAAVEIQYRRGVRPEGNPRARDMMDRVFRPVDSNWRGIGAVPDSGLALAESFAQRDAFSRFDVPQVESREPAGCICGKILRGVASPSECALFGTRCTPSSPVGACMVSSEGACQASYRYGGIRQSG